MWDVFICHAWEDKETIARPLADALSHAGLRVWYDELTLSLGDSLRRSIDRGLAESKYGVVILSPHFFDKKWPQSELDGLFAREVSSSGKVILPVWHNANYEEVKRFSSTLAGKLSVSTDKGLDNVVQEILRVLRPEAVPAHDTARESLSDLMNSAEANRVAGRFDDAIRDATEVLRIEPRNTIALNTRARAYGSLGQFDNAIRDATEALRIEPRKASALSIRARAHLDLKRYDDAIRDATEALRIEPRDVFALNTRAAAYRWLRRYDGAIRDATEVLRIEPRDAVALNTRAAAYLVIERYDDAIRDATEVLRIEPQDIVALNTRAEAYRGIGRFDDAIRDAEESLRIEPGNTFALTILKWSHSAKG